MKNKKMKLNPLNKIEELANLIAKLNLNKKIKDCIDYVLNRAVNKESTAQKIIWSVKDCKSDSKIMLVLMKMCFAEKMYLPAV